MIKKDSKYVVYWLKYDSHSDPYKEGYIGITYNFEKRKQHHSKYGSRILKNRIKKGAYFEIIHENLTPEEACVLEEQYRPIPDIGWNVNKGGNIPPSQKGKHHIKNSLVGDQRTDAQKAASLKLSRILTGRPSPKRKSCVLFGVEYPSVNKALEVLGLSTSQYYHYMNSHKQYQSVASLKQDIHEQKLKKLKLHLQKLNASRSV